MQHTHKVVEGEAGFITEAKGYLLSLEGFPSVRINDIVSNTSGERAIITALDEESVEALLLDRGTPEAGDQFTIYTRGIQFPFGDHVLGRVLNALGDPLDGKESLPNVSGAIHLDSQAPGMSVRAPIQKQLKTGIAAIDILLPIAKGQRQLVIGPISSGKEVFVESVVAHQKHEPSAIAIYTFVGKPVSYVEESARRLLAKEQNAQTIVLAAFSDDPAPIIALTPTVSLALAEYFSTQGKDVLLILDDLGSHAKYLREIALLSGRIPGRESYPGDMFYQHARLLEKAGQFNKVIGSGSITILPMIETNIEDITDLVPTNLMSATDGHLFFSPLLHAEGYFPSVVSNQSVTRVGRQTQSTLAKQLSIRVQALLAEYERQRDYSQFGTQLSEQTRKVINRGEVANFFLQQEPLSNTPLEVQTSLLTLVFTSLFEKHDLTFAKRNKKILLETLATNKSLAPILSSARRGTVTLDPFIKKLEGVLPYIESVCQQP